MIVVGQSCTHKLHTNTKYLQKISLNTVIRNDQHLQQNPIYTKTHTHTYTYTRTDHYFRLTPLLPPCHLPTLLAGCLRIEMPKTTRKSDNFFISYPAEPFQQAVVWPTTYTQPQTTIQAAPHLLMPPMAAAQPPPPPLLLGTSDYLSSNTTLHQVGVSFLSLYSNRYCVCACAFARSLINAALVVFLFSTHRR